VKPAYPIKLIALTIGTLLSTLCQSPAPVVGYINVAMPTGWRAVVRQLESPDANANVVLVNATPPDGALLYRYNSTTQDFFNAATYVTNVGWYPVSGNTNDPALQLPLGEGFLVWSPAAWTCTFVGEVAQGTLTNQLPPNYSLKGSIVPQGGLLQTMLGYPAHEGDVIFSGAPGAWTPYTFDPFEFFWTPSEPNIAVGQGFFVFRTIANQPWVRNFTVNRMSTPPAEPEPSPEITSYNIRDGIITLKVEKNTKRYNVQYSTDRETWINVATDQTATTWRGNVPAGPRGFWQVAQP